MTALAVLTGYLLGSIPTAGALGALWGVQLRKAGSGNPGANNALRLGGPILAATVLLVELAKGLAAVRLGATLADDPGSVAAAIGAVAGNVYNVWYRFKGGKGLAITAGVLLGAAPALLLPSLIVLVLVVVATHSSSIATLAAVLTLSLAATVLWLSGWHVGWGVGQGPLVVVLAIGIGAVLWSRHVGDTRVSSPLPR